MTDRTVRIVALEQQRQHAKWGFPQFSGMLPERVLAVLTEELGELAEAILKQTNVEEELIHVAAVAVSWLDECWQQEEEDER